MNDFVVFGGASAVYRADHRTAYGSSAETAQVCDLLTGLTYPQEEAGDVVFRRVYVPVEWANGVSLTVTPVIDGEELTLYRRTFNRSGAGREEIMLPLAKRGGRFALRIQSAAPTGPFWIDTTVWVALHPALPAKAGT